MQHSELLHRFFDEGLDEPLEDVLFGQMALDPELRREFVSHLKLHSIIQEDVAGITTPSYVSQRLFTSLGLQPPDNAAPTAAIGSRLREGAGTALLKLRTLVGAHRGHVYTAVISALATAVLLLQFGTSGVDILDSTIAESPAEVTPAPAPPVPSSPSRLMASSTRTALPAVEAVLPTAQPEAFPSQAERAATSERTTSEFTELAGTQTELPSPLDAEWPAVADDMDTRVADAMARHTEVDIPAVPEIDPPWRFTQPGPRENILSNLVFELRKYYGQSFPEVDLPHNSFNVFENMAVSVIYKTTEHHAFGFEYGRENFGREFQRSIEQQPMQLGADPSSAQIYRPPAQSMAGLQRENRMLDLVGAVWKLSLPEYGLFDVVYPYLRTFVGATKLGPVGKVRAGLEMYPSNYSMLNVGVEGGMLRYTVDDMSYYTAKLNFTFGVAIGF